MTRGRDTNEMYLERTIVEADHQHRDEQAPGGIHVAQGGTTAEAARMLRQIVGRDDRARTAHQTAADTPAQLLPELVANLVAEHHSALTRRHTSYHKIRRAQRDRALDRTRGLHRGRSGTRSGLRPRPLTKHTTTRRCVAQSQDRDMDRHDAASGSSQRRLLAGGKWMDSADEC